MDEHIDDCALVNGLGRIPYAERLLLLPHCLRPSDGCPGRMTKQGLNCEGCTRSDCAIYQLRSAAIEVGYGGVCVAPGGRLAARYVAEHKPAGIVAIACEKELIEGRQAVQKMGWASGAGMPASAIVPLLRDGCVDTEVDVALARAVIVSYVGDDGP